MQLKRLIFTLLLIPSIGFCGNLTLGGAGTGSLVITAPTTGTSVSVYPATATASFPFGVSASTISVSSNTIIPGSTFYANSFELRSSSIVFTPSTIGIFGTQTNDNALGGYVGQSTMSVVTTPVNFTGSGTFSDLTSLILTPGDWDVSACIDQVANGATITEVRMAITSTSGNSTTGMNAGDNLSSGSPAVNAVRTSTICIPSFRISLSAVTQYYLKFESSYSSATPQAVGRISARRVR